MSKWWEELLEGGLIGMGIAGTFLYMEELRRMIPKPPTTPLQEKTKDLVDSWDNYWKEVVTEAGRKEMLKEAADIARRQQSFNKRFGKFLPPPTWMIK